MEFFTYDSHLNLAFDKFDTKKANKIYHGPAPIIIKFKETPKYDKNDKYNRIYLNIDGEFYHLVKPEELRVRLAKSYNGGTLKFLQRLK